MKPSLSVLTVLGVFAGGLVTSAGCKKNEPTTVANGTGTWGYGANGGTTPTTTTPPPTTTVAPPPATTAAPTATAAPAPPAGQTFDASALQPLLTPLAAQHAKGAKADGPTLGGMLQTGQSIEQNVQLAPSGTKCYTAIAVGAPSLTELQLEMVLNMAPLPPTVVAQAQTPANPAVLAGSPNCYKNITPIAGMVKLKVTAKTGSGPVLVQLYSK